MIFQIVAVFVTDTEFGYVRPEFETKKERTEYLETVARKNLFAIDGAAIEAGDKLLTLSTCCTLYGKNETGDQRLVVAAKLLPTAAEEAPTPCRTQNSRSCRRINNGKEPTENSRWLFCSLPKAPVQ